MPLVSIDSKSMISAAAVLVLSGCTTAPSPSAGPPSGQSASGSIRLERSATLAESGETSAAVSLGDLDGDGNLDLVLSTGRHWASPLRLYLNDGLGHFRDPHNLSDRPYKSYGVPLADLDRDGDLDLAVGTDGGEEKPVFLNDGKGGFTLAGSYAGKEMSVRNLELADMDGDGAVDIVASGRGTPCFIAWNDGRGAFPRTTPFGVPGAQTVTVAVGDVDGDGRPDLALANRGSQSAVWINDGQGGFGDPRPLGPERADTRTVALGDVDGDGDLDVAASHLTQESQGNVLYLNDGKGRWERTVPLGSPEDGSYSLAFADLDRDGRLDVVAGTVERPNVAYLSSDESFRSVQFGKAVAEGVSYGLAVGDVNGDGWPDVAVARSGGPSEVYTNSPASR